MMEVNDSFRPFHTASASLLVPHSVGLLQPLMYSYRLSQSLLRYKSRVADETGTIQFLL